MLRYLLKRLFILIPLLLLISVIAFILSLSTPGDPVDRLLQSAETGEGGAGSATRMNRDKEAEKLREKLGLNLPVFYLSIQTLADIDTLYKIKNPLHHDALKRMARETGKPEMVLLWYDVQEDIKSEFRKAKDDSSRQLMKNYQIQMSASESLLEGVITSSNCEEQKLKIDSLSNLLSLIPEITKLRSKWEIGLSQYTSLYTLTHPWKRYIPSPHFYGLNNQYHYWLFGKKDVSLGAIRGDFGISFRDGQKISTRIGKAMKWTLFISITSLFIAFICSIPLGLIAGRYADSAFDKITSIIVFGLYALPGFFVASLLLILFANPDFMDWFPSSGVRDPELFDNTWTPIQRLIHYLPYLILPIICLSYASLAFISRQVRAGVIEAYSMGYVKTARAKGLSENKILIKHILPNILFPLITLLGQTLPVLFGGSVIIEGIFNIPGIGLEMYESVINFDYPMIVAIFTIIGFLTILGYLLSDILYTLVDPRVKLNSVNNE
ncbi:MAG: ABC transporter permease [Bacteroidia bacterium]